MDALIQSLVQANFAPERIAPQASMAQYTTLRIGGPAEVMVNIHSADEIAVALRAAKQADAPVTIIGNGSNLLVRDGGVEGLVIQIGSNMSGVRIDGTDLFDHSLRIRLHLRPRGTAIRLVADLVENV